MAKSLLLLYPDGGTKQGGMMPLDGNSSIGRDEERKAAALILKCEKVRCLEIVMRHEDGVRSANLYFDGDGEDKGLEPNTRIEEMLLKAHDQSKAPLPELGVKVFGVVVLIPTVSPEPTSTQGSMIA